MSGKTKSCGCLQADRASESNTKDFSGQVSSSGVKLLSPSFKNENGVWMWKCLCPLCGKTFDALPAKVLSNHTTSCGCKISSSPERIITSILDELGINYSKQYRFSDCRDKYSLPFDFAIFNGDTLMFLIEYDGEQHFRPVDFWGGDEAFEIRKRHDSIKDEYCKSHGIPLFRFSYVNDEEEIRTKITNIIYP